MANLEGGAEIPLRIKSLDFAAGITDAFYSGGKYYVSVSGEVFSRGFFASGKSALWGCREAALVSPDLALSGDVGFAKAVYRRSRYGEEEVLSLAGFFSADFSGDAFDSFSWDYRVGASALGTSGGLALYGSFSFLPVAARIYEHQEWSNLSLGIYAPQAVFQVGYSAGRFASSLSLQLTPVCLEAKAEASYAGIRVYATTSQEYGVSSDLLQLYRSVSGKKKGVSLFEVGGKVGLEYGKKEGLGEEEIVAVVVERPDEGCEPRAELEQVKRSYQIIYGSVAPFDAAYQAFRSWLAENGCTREDIDRGRFIERMNELFPGLRRADAASQQFFLDFLLLADELMEWEGNYDETTGLVSYAKVAGSGECVPLSPMMRAVLASDEANCQTVADSLSSLPRERQVESLAALANMMAKLIYDEAMELGSAQNFTPDRSIALLAEALRQGKKIPGPVCSGIHAAVSEIADRLGMAGYTVSFRWGGMHAASLLQDQKTGEWYLVNYGQVIQFRSISELPGILENFGGEAGSKNPIAVIYGRNGYPLATMRLRDISDKIFVPHEEQVKKALYRVGEGGR